MREDMSDFCCTRSDYFINYAKASGIENGTSDGEIEHIPVNSECPLQLWLITRNCLVS
jgi:hypothetical protein